MANNQFLKIILDDQDGCQLYKLSPNSAQNTILIIFLVTFY